MITFSFIENETNAMHGGGYFYSELSSYGTWIELDYGTLVWRPTIIKRSWAPYSYGSWIWTDYGWYWDSYEPYGYIVFHYGRWYYDDYYGWIWVPDYEWAPAWVEWRYDDDYIGWAPLSPYASFSINVGIYFTTNYYVPYTHWHFVNYNNFCNTHVYNYYAGPEYKYRIYSRTKVRTNYDYYNGRVRNRGVDLKYVENRSGQKIRQRDIYRESDPVKYISTRESNKERIVTFDADRNVLEREDVRNLKVEKNSGRSKLDMNKVELRSRENLNQKREVGRNESEMKIRKDVEIQQRDVKKQNDVKRNTEIKRDNSNTEKNVKRQSQIDLNKNTRKQSSTTDHNSGLIKKQGNTGNDQKIIRKDVETKKNPVVRNENSRNKNTETKQQNTVRKNEQTIKKDNGTVDRNTNKTQDSQRNKNSNNDRTRKR